MESILKDILSVLRNVNVNTEEISSLISRLRNTLNNGSAKYELSASDSTAIEDIMRRADEIRLKRNRLVHDTGMENNYLESDADDIYKNVNLIIERYIKTEVSKTIYRRNKDALHEAEQGQAEPTFQMFIYTPVELDMPLDINDPKIKETLQVLEEYKKDCEAGMQL